MSPELELARTHLSDLSEELAAAVENGIAGNSLYQADLQQEMALAEAAYVAAAVTEIASFRAQLSGPQVG